MEKNHPAGEKLSIFKGILFSILFPSSLNNPNKDDCLRSVPRVGRRDAEQLKNLLTPFGSKPDRKNW